MAEEKTKVDYNQLQQIVYNELEYHLGQLLGEESRDNAMTTLSGLAQKGKEGLQFASDLVAELATELTGVKSFKVIPGKDEFDVDIRCKKEQDFNLKKKIGPMAEICTVHFGKQISFGARLDKDKKGLHLNVKKGMSVVVNLGPLGKTEIPIEGSGFLTRNDKKQLVLQTTIVIPGIETPVDVTIPLSLLFSQG